jgi:PadR family transcriptional regulator AphA
MSLRHALLGMLSIGPMTGYDLLDHFDRSAGLVWSASQAQMYPELRVMEADGLVSAKVAARGKHGQKRVYSITRKGTSELRRWAGEPVTYPPTRDPALLKVSYLDLATGAEARALFEGHIAHHGARRTLAEERLKTLRAGKTRRQALPDPHEREAAAAFRVLVLEQQIASANAEIAWGRRGLEVVSRLDDEHD